MHLHFFGTATLSFADGIRVRSPAMTFEIDLPALGAPLINPLAGAPPDFSLPGVRRAVPPVLRRVQKGKGYDK